jgi:hypothetical protein
MPTVTYTTTRFREPGIISEEMYNKAKEQLKMNPDFEIDPNFETFSQHFKVSLTTITICLIVGVLCLLIGLTSTSHTGDFGDMLAIPCGICFLIVIICSVFVLLPEGPSYATYAKKHEEYFDRMKYAIKNSSSYSEFISIFYK